MSVKLLESKTLYRHYEYYASFPSVILSNAGEVLVAFRRAPDHRWIANPDGNYPPKEYHDEVDHLHARSHIALLRLDQDLNQIGDLSILPVSGDMADQDPSLITLNSGRILQLGFGFYPVLPEYYEMLKEQGANPRRVGDLLGVDYLFWGAYTRISDDGGHSWSQPKPFPKSEKCVIENEIAAKSFCGGPLRGRPIELDDGRVVCAVYRGPTCGRGHEVSQIYQSTDEGETWAEAGLEFVMDDVHLREPALANWPKEDQVTLFHRTKGIGDVDPLVTLSLNVTDLSIPTDIKDDHQVHEMIGHPYDPLVLSDGRLFLSYGYRHEGYGVRARLVDAGQDIDDAKEIIICDDNHGPDCGYPWSIELPNGNILNVYYKSCEHGIRGIEAQVLKV